MLKKREDNYILRFFVAWEKNRDFAKPNMHFKILSMTFKK